MDIFSTSASGLFTSSAQQAAQLDRLSQSALAGGLELYSAGKYDEAIRELKRAVSLAPVSTQAIDAYKYIAQAYVNKGENQRAIDTYRTSLKLSANNAETYASLGKVHFSEKNYSEAIKAFKNAVNLDPNAANRYSLGQALLADGQTDAAESEFEMVRRLEPDKPSGDYGLGQVYAREGRTAEAISAFDKALALQGDFLYALADKGYALADAGDSAQAAEIAAELKDSSPDLADALNNYIYQKTPPEIIAAYAESSFPVELGPGTSAYKLGLNGAGDSKIFSMVFQFSKEMDAVSVENVLNWSITRAVGTGRGDGYNFNMEVPDTEITPFRLPISVSYDPRYFTATVWFQISENEEGNGTIDPSHIQFSFKGKDVFGRSMSGKADQFTGFSGIA